MCEFELSVHETIFIEATLLDTGPKPGVPLGKEEVLGVVLATPPRKTFNRY